ncbi:hypothetical protein ACLI4Z_16185 [Natrialbaceae archaeon A-arb3/5]
MDGIDAVSLVGLAAVIVASTVLEGIVVAAVFGGFALSLACWRVYGGRPWEGIAWLLWAVAAVAVLFAPGHVVFMAAFFGFVLLGVGVLFGSRFELLPAIWSVENE